MKKIISLILCFVVLTSCSSDSSDESSLTGSITASIDGQNWRSNVAVAAVQSINFGEINGSVLQILGTASNSSNVLKDNIDKNITRSGSYDHGIERCIRESLRHKKYKVQQDHLAKLFDEFAMGENAFVSKYFRKPGDPDEAVVENIDFQLAKLYCDLLKSYPTSQLRFSEFKRIMSKKRCEITRQEFGGILDKRVLLRNPEYSLSKSNIILVNESTYFFASKLSNISKQYGLTEKQVVQCMNLGGF